MTTEEVVEDILSHHGVLGMKWGVRRAASGIGRYGKDVAFELHTGSNVNIRKIAESASNKFEADLPGLKEKHGASAELRTRIKSPLSKESRAYRKDASATYLNRLEEAANEHVNASGTRQRTVTTTQQAIRRKPGTKYQLHIVEEEHPNTHKYLWHVRTREIKHDVNHLCTVQPMMGGDGFITKVKHVSSSMTQSAMGEDYILEHFGIKGMHWGVRNARPVSTETHRDVGVVRRQTKVRASGGEAHPAHPDAVKAAVQKQKLKKSGTDALSTQELRDLTGRLQLEAQVNTLTTKRGKKFAQRQLEVQGQQGVQRGITRAAPAAFRVAKKGAATAAVTALI